MRRVFCAILLAVLATPSSLAQAQETLAPEAQAAFGGPAGRALRVVGTTDIAAFAPLLEEFVGANPAIAVAYEQWGSNDLAASVARACAGEAGSPDMVISSAVDLQVRLVNEGCAQAWRSPLTAALPATQRWRDELFGITREPAVMVYNRDLVPPSEAPQSRFDLIDLLRPDNTRYAGRVATYDIEASGLGYLFAFVDAQQATTFGALFEAFGRSGAVATCCSAEIIDGVADGRYLIAYNVLGSYAIAAAERDRRLAVVAPSDYTLVLSRAALIPKDAPNAADAGRLLDYILSPAGQAALSRARLVVPLDGKDGSLFEDADGAGSTLRAIPLSPALMVGLDAHKRRLFIERWRDVFPRD